jgi:DMSO/TMAO reductase YedYZ heme-binding membrane subunit
MADETGLAQTREDIAVYRDHPDIHSPSERVIQPREARTTRVSKPAARDGSNARKLADLQGARKTALFLLGLPALAPIVFMLPAIVHLSGVTHDAGNDVLGTGGALLLFAALAITPLITITGHRWFAALRQWYGIVFALDIITDALLALNDPAFGSNISADLTGHTFLLAGTTMVICSLPLLGTAHRRAQRWFGKYWKRIQSVGTYTIWAIFGIHLALLEGFGYSQTDSMGIFHQRFYEYLACTIPLVVFRIGPVRRYCQSDIRYKRFVIVSLMMLFALGYVFFINELIFKGVAAYRLNPIQD